MIEPRGLSKEQAAAYAGCQTLSAFNDCIRRGIMPDRFPGTHKWDRRAIDAALARLSGLQPKLSPNYHHTTRGRHPKMRVRLKGINWSIKKLADGTSKTYWYAWKGGPRIDAH